MEYFWWHFAHFPQLWDKNSCQKTWLKFIQVSHNWRAICHADPPCKQLPILINPLNELTHFEKNILVLIQPTHFHKSIFTLAETDANIDLMTEPLLCRIALYRDWYRHRHWLNAEIFVYMSKIKLQKLLVIKVADKMGLVPIGVFPK